MSSGWIRQPLRTLLLPTRAGTEASCGFALKATLEGFGLTPQDFLSWVVTETDNWRLTRTPSEQLKSVVADVILASCNGASIDVVAQGSQLATKYFLLHEKLMQEHLMAHDEAIAFISNSFLIAYLAFSEKFSAAQISNLLSQRDQRAKFSRQSINAALQVMRIAPALSEQQIATLYRRDTAQELSMLADADLTASAEKVADAGTKLGFPNNLLSAMKTLNPVIVAGGMSSAYTPYLQILHYQCSLAEFFDHAVTDIYEFSPRGRKGEWLHRQYPHAIAGASNPFLNNAKSVEILDASWARSKKNQERPGAMALLSILEGMQAMGFSARRELAWWLRLWLHRIIRIAGTTPITIPPNLQVNQITSLITAISSGNTSTFGILEQRSIDAIASTIHPNWRPRGLGDSVNATNLSRAKLGDCEFLDDVSKTVEAYESHGGVLNRLYVDEHIATLRKSILQRIGELNAIADPTMWNARITFVAHVIQGALPPSVIIEGLNINIRAMTFSDFFATYAATITPIISQSVANHMLVPIQEQRTPNEVRQKLLAII